MSSFIRIDFMLELIVFATTTLLSFYYTGPRVGKLNIEEIMLEHD